MKKLLLTVAMVSLAAPALAGEWKHATAPMGQYEGQIRMEDDSYGMSYGCAGSYSSFGFWANGSHGESGESAIEVDGKKVGTLETTYNSAGDSTLANFHVKYSEDEDQFEAYTAMMNALATGHEAVWTTPSGKVFTYPLKNSATIRVCLPS